MEVAQHRAFDEGTAILAGDALQALAFAVLARGMGIETLTVVATATGYNLIHHGNAAAIPDATGLSPAALTIQLQERAHATPL